MLTRKHKLFINYILKKRIRSLEDLIEARKYVVSFRDIAKAEWVHKLAIPMSKPLFLFREIRDYVSYIHGIYVLRDFAERVENALDVFIPLAKNRDLWKLVYSEFDRIYMNPLMRRDIINEDALSILEELNAIDIVRRSDGERALFVNYNRRIPWNVKRNLILKSIPIRLLDIRALGIKVGVQRATLPSRKQYYLLNTFLDRGVKTSIVPYVSEVLQYLRPEHRDWIPNKLQKEIAGYLAKKFGYEIRIVYSGRFHLLLNKDLIPQGILIQVVSRYDSIPHYKVIPEIKRRYNLRSLGRLLIFQNPLYGDVKGWHVIYWNPKKGWEIKFANEKSIKIHQLG